MRIIIAPAKKMNVDTDSFAVRDLPHFLEDTQRLMEAMRAMQARLSVGGVGDLYAFWAGQLGERLAAETDCVLNLASREYSRAVEPHLPPGVQRLQRT